MKTTFATLAVASLLIAPGIDSLVEARGTAGAVYTMTNAASGNAVVAYDRLANGSLRYSATYPTGGDGTGGGLGNQGGVVLSDNGRWLLVVNAGSDEVSLFSVHRRGLALRDTVHSGGDLPISVAIHRDLVYVVHRTSADIAGFRIGPGGTLTSVPGSHQPLSDPTADPAQIGFAPDGRHLLVTEKGTNVIDVFPVYEDGSVGPADSYPSHGMTPFALGFGKRDQVFVSEVFGGADDAGAVSSYALTPDGVLEVLDGSVPNTETAPCWLVVTQGGRYLFTTNTPDDSLSAYAIDFEGKLTLVDADGRTGEPGTGTSPLDMDLSDDGRFLYTLDIGTDTISTFRVRPDGSLRLLVAITGVPDGANGLAAR